MADAAISCILGYLKELAVYQYKLICDSEVELKDLTTDLKHLQSILKKAARARDKGEVLKTYEKEIRNLIYEAEETIDSHVTRASVKGKTPHKDFFSKLFGRERILAEDVQRIRKQIRDIDHRMVKEMQLDQTPNKAEQEATRTVTGIRQIDPESNNAVVGFKDVIQEWGAKLRNDEIEVIAVEGMPGLGKTTVAYELFNDPATKSEFPERIWLNVSDEPCNKDIYLRILQQFRSQDVSHLSESQLVDTVRENFLRVRFLLVVDDVWNIRTWREIDYILPPLSKGSFKVLLTTRHDDVAKEATRPDRGEICKLRKLDEDESWELLQLKVYENTSSWPKELEEDGKKIAKGCDGLPLALVVIGGMLRSNLSTPVDTTTRDYFQNVSKDVHEHFLLQDKEEAVEKIISLSYDNLPYYLRDCFLYLGVFPAGHHISTWKLKCLWIAEGFIMNEHGVDSSLEEIADGYVEELVRRNLLKVIGKNAEEKVKTCCVHGAIREFCKNFGKYQKLFQEIRKSRNGGGFYPDVSNTSSFRRICIHSAILDLFKEKEIVFQKARSFLCFPKEIIYVPQECVSSVLDPFELLRVFEGSSLKLRVFPEKLNELIHLRYLALAAGDFNKLPKTVNKLWRLQTLVIVTLSHNFEIKVDLSDMPQLRHVKTKGTLIIKAKHDEAGSSKKYFKYLHTLSRISADSCDAGLMEKAKYLKTLGIRGQLDPLMSNDSVLKTLDLLKLKMIHTAAASPPLSDCFPANLKTLTLSATKLDWNNMGTLGRLVHLQVLKLKELAFKGEREQWKDDGNGFRSLRYLQVERSDLITWEITPDSFHSLEYLSLKACISLHHIPASLSKSLHTLEIESATECVLRSAKTIEDMIKNRGRKFELMTTPSANTT